MLTGFGYNYPKNISGGDLSIMFNLIFNLTFEGAFLLSLPLA